MPLLMQVCVWLTITICDVSADTFLLSLSGYVTSAAHDNVEKTLQKAPRLA